MAPIVIESRADADGVVRLELPLGAAEAGRGVRVTVEPAPAPEMTRTEWEDWVESMAGTWQGEFERPPQGELEEREPLS